MSYITNNKKFYITIPLIVSVVEAPKDKRFIFNLIPEGLL